MCLEEPALTVDYLLECKTDDSLKGRSYLFTSNSGNGLLICIVYVSTHIHALSLPLKPFAGGFALRGAEMAEGVFTPVCLSGLHQAGDGRACCKGKRACLSSFWHVYPLVDCWSPHCILKTEVSRK